MAKIDRLLTQMVDREASDLHLSTQYRPCFRIHGDMTFLTEEPELDDESNREIIYEIMPERNREDFETRWDTDFAYSIEGTGRFRVNVFKDLHGIGAVLRIIPEVPLTLEQIGLAASTAIRYFCSSNKGLLIITGPTGSGKTTTLAAIVDFLNRTRTGHIITVEDPIEFVHTSKGCLINQREVHAHTKNFSGALRSALREDPDIVLLGEMRDLETTEVALEMAETGHLVLATLHTNTATSTVERIIDQFPGDQQNQIRSLLSNTLLGVMAQTLCKKQDGGRMLAPEIMVCTPGIRSNIRDGKTHVIPSSIQTGKQLGMVMLEDSLFRMVSDGMISPKEGYLQAIDKPFFEKKLADNGFALDKELVELDQFFASDDSEKEAGEEQTPEQLKERAWKLVTNQNTQSRDGSAAIALVSKAIQMSETDAECSMILAAAHAQKGEFKAALETVKTAMQQAKKEKNAELTTALKNQLAYYKKSEPLPGPSV
jgi:twitching motility protein PilT